MPSIPRAVLALAALTSLASGPTPARAQRPRPAELAKLDFLVGEFRGEVQLFQPDIAPIKGPMNFTGAWDLDSAWVTARYDQTPMGRTLRGLLLFTYDLPAQRYLFYGVPNSPMDVNKMRGRLDGTTLVFETDTTGRMAYRETWAPAGRDTLITALSYKRDGAWVTGTRAVLVRVKR